MRVIRDPQKLNHLLKKLNCQGKKLGFVPTMGALHPGHLSLIKKARQDNDTVIVSVFINPAQFGPKEDLKKYPRPLKKDLELCVREGVDFVFLPTGSKMYPRGYSTFVEVEGLSSLLCARARPGHFRGVATVVVKLLNIVPCDTLYLGQKDAQQAIIIGRMVKDLNFPVKIKVMPIVRAEDGLALSSRNIYLSSKERLEAQVLYKALSLARSLYRHGLKDCPRLISRMKELINKQSRARIDYAEIVALEDLKKIKKIDQDCLVALAVKFGNTRLIDNIIIKHG